jgi:hypothetical protein
LFACAFNRLRKFAHSAETVMLFCFFSLHPASPVAGALMSHCHLQATLFMYHQDHAFFSRRVRSIRLLRIKIALAFDTFALNISISCQRPIKCIICFSYVHWELAPDFLSSGNMTF